jgi:hypothetical protein
MTLALTQFLREKTWSFGNFGCISYNISGVSACGVVKSRSHFSSYLAICNDCEQGSRNSPASLFLLGLISKLLALNTSKNRVVACRLRRDRQKRKFGS